ADVAGGTAEGGLVGADAQMAAGREPQAAADAIAADHGDGRLRKLVDAGIGRFRLGAIGARRFEIGALALAPPKGAAGDESLAASAGYDHDKDVVVGGEVVENPL